MSEKEALLPTKGIFLGLLP